MSMTQAARARGHPGYERGRVDAEPRPGYRGLLESSNRCSTPRAAPPGWKTSATKASASRCACCSAGSRRSRSHAARPLVARHDMVGLLANRLRLQEDQQAQSRHWRRTHRAAALHRGTSAHREHPAPSFARAGSGKPRGPGVGSDVSVSSAAAGTLRNGPAHRAGRPTAPLVRCARSRFQDDPSGRRPARAGMHRLHEPLVPVLAVQHDLPRAQLPGMAGGTRTSSGLRVP